MCAAAAPEASEFGQSEAPPKAARWLAMTGPRRPPASVSRDVEARRRALGIVVGIIVFILVAGAILLTTTAGRIDDPPRPVPPPGEPHPAEGPVL